MFAFFLSSGFFLGWSLGANDASNVFGTAVGSGMIRFRTAALWCSVFVILGAVLSGAGASHTLGKLGAVNALGGAFMVALAAAVTVYLMTWLKFPVSTSQAIVGAIIGWNYFTGSLVDYGALTKIVSTWVACPLLAAGFAVILYKVLTPGIRHHRINMFTLDTMTRWGLLLAGVFGSYALGANNIANVMGVFVPVAPFGEITLFDGLFALSGEQQLYLIGGVAIAVGVFTYSRRVMLTVGSGILPLTPVAAFVVVTAHSLVLFVFSSHELQQAMVNMGLPPIPLVPVSSSQAIVGAVIGIGLLKGGRGIRWRVVGGIASGWATTPVIAAFVSFVCLFFLQNVFQQQTYRPVRFEVTFSALERLDAEGVDTGRLAALRGVTHENAVAFRDALEAVPGLDGAARKKIMAAAELDELFVTEDRITRIPVGWVTRRERNALQDLEGRFFMHRWVLRRELAKAAPEWREQPGQDAYNRDLAAKVEYVCRYLRRGGGL
ncbi:MAG: inorganic phosphate transporter [Desulfovibrionaceae bacterium]